MWVEAFHLGGSQNDPSEDPEVKRCECGCGFPAPIATKTRSRLGHIKGEAIRFINGHQKSAPAVRDKISATLRGRPLAEETKRKLSASLRGRQFSMETRQKMSRARQGWRPTAETRRRMSKAHLGKQTGSENPRWKGDAAKYAAQHHWIRSHKTKTGICEECQRDLGPNGPRGTQWANISGDYRRDVDDFRELCPPCHRRFDVSRRRAST